MSEILINNEVVKVHPEFHLYGATESGKIYRIDRKKLLKHTYNKRAKYNYTRLSQNNTPKTLRVHIFIAKCWLPNPNNFRVVNHKDGDKLNNLVSNLEWCSDSQNQQHALDTGLKQKGEDLYNAKLSNEQVHKVCKLLEEGYRVKDLADMFGVNTDNIRKIKDGSCFFDIRQLYVNIPHKFVTEYSVGTVEWVCSKIKEGLSDINIAKTSTSGITTIDVKRIRNKIRYTEITDKYF
ncbi:homing endonuclease HNH [Shewanella sp. phage 1/40]|uniref:HNH endonuclease n=1 Tax=Shewanella sp. phage 1/40 TaxID=1458860 RepID=UPI0004F81380|nr:HNH endonuclease [Shewanella sp. phage 1/40]AHK11566.1 homing endonuclease HNH [Shewanella sp. phage 1/40]